MRTQALPAAACDEDPRHAEPSPARPARRDAAGARLGWFAALGRLPRRDLACFVPSQCDAIVSRRQGLCPTSALARGARAAAVRARRPAARGLASRGAGAYAAQRAIGAYTTRRAAASDDPRTIVGLMAGSMIGRGWLVALTIFAVGPGRQRRRPRRRRPRSSSSSPSTSPCSMILRPFENDARSVHERAARLARGLLTLGARCCSSRPARFALSVNEDFKPQNEFKLDPWISIHIGAARPLDQQGRALPRRSRGR